MPVNYPIEELDLDGVRSVLPESIDPNSQMAITEEAWISEETTGLCRNEPPRFDLDEPKSHLAREHQSLFEDIRDAVARNVAKETFTVNPDKDGQREGGPRTILMNYQIMNVGLREAGWAIAESPKKSDFLRELGYEPSNHGTVDKGDCKFEYKDISVEIDAAKDGCLAEIQFGNQANMKENIAYQFSLAKKTSPSEVDAAVMVVPSTTFTKYVSGSTAQFDNTCRILEVCWELLDPDYRVPVTVLGIGFEQSPQQTLPV